MGFMAGFGAAFSNSFQQAEDNRAQEKRDAFKVSYDSIMSHKTQYEADSKKDKELIRQAKAVARMAGAPDAAWTDAYDILLSGASPEFAIKTVSGTKYNPIDSNADVTSETTSPNVDQQMQDSGLGNNENSSNTTTQPDINTNQETNNMNTAVPSPIVAPDVQGPISSAIDNSNTTDNIIPPTQPNPSNADNSNSYKSEFGGLGNPFDKTQQLQRKGDEAQSAVIAAMGESPEQIDQYMKGYIPLTPEATVIAERASTTANPLTAFGLEDGITPAKYAAAKTRVESLRNSSKPADQGMVMAWDSLEATMKDAMAAAQTTTLDGPTLGALLTSSREMRTSVSDLKTAAVTAISEGRNLVDIANQRPEVLTATGAGVAAFENFKNEWNTVIGLFNPEDTQVMSADQINTMEQQATSLFEKSVSGGDARLSDIATQQQLFNAGLIRYVFSIGKANGQSGNGFSNADYANILQSISNSPNKEAFEANIKQLSTEMIDKYNVKSNEFKTSLEGQLLAETPNTATQLANSLDLQLDEDTQNWLNNKNVVNNTNTSISDPSDTSSFQIMVTPEAVAQEPLLKPYLGKTITIDSNGNVK